MLMSRTINLGRAFCAATGLHAVLHEVDARAALVAFQGAADEELVALLILRP
jgi:hypothetical protein